MVYNTTDNSTSLTMPDITDLTSDCEYSVTVAGRDGAGRLGENISKEFKFSCKLHNYKYILICISRISIITIGESADDNFVTDLTDVLQFKLGNGTLLLIRWKVCIDKIIIIYRFH